MNIRGQDKRGQSKIMTYVAYGRDRGDFTLTPESGIEMILL